MKEEIKGFGGCIEGSDCHVSVDSEIGKSWLQEIMSGRLKLESMISTGYRDHSKEGRSIKYMVAEL